MSDANYSNEIKIIFSEELPNNGGGILLHYDHEPVSVTGWLTHDVRETVAENEDRWLSQIELWHKGVTKEALISTKWWWLYQGSRLILWETTTSFSLKPILFALSIIDISTQNPTKNIWVITSKQELITHITIWSNSISNVKVMNACRRKKKALINSRFIEKIFFLNNFLKKIIQYSILILMQRKKTIHRTSVLINSSVINARLLDTIGDHYFGSMFDDIKCLRKKDITWLYNDIQLNNRRTHSKLQKIGKHAYFNIELFNYSDLIFAVCAGVKAHWALRKLNSNSMQLKINNFDFPMFANFYTQNLVFSSIPIYEFMIYKQFSRILKTSKANKLIYPYEEKPVERAMLLAIQDTNPSVETIAFAHAAYTKGHMYIKPISDQPRPKVIAVNGDAPRERFCKAGVPNEQLLTIGSPRYHIKNTNLVSEQNNYNKILLICGLGFELRIFASYLEKNKNILDGYELTIRRCYHSWISEQDAAELKLQSAGIKYNCEDGDLFKQIDSADIIIFESTSAGMEAVLRGKIVIRLNLCDIISTKHFYGKYDSGEIKYCRNIVELEKELNTISLLSFELYCKKNQRQRDQVKYLYSPINRDVVNNLLCESENN